MEWEAKPLCPLHSLKRISLHCHMCTHMKCLRLLQYTVLTKGTCAWVEDKERQTCSDDADLWLRLPPRLSAKHRPGGQWVPTWLRWMAAAVGTWQRVLIVSITSGCKRYFTALEKLWHSLMVLMNDQIVMVCLRVPWLIIFPLILFHLYRHQPASYSMKSRNKECLPPIIGDQIHSDEITQCQCCSAYFPVFVAEKSQTPSSE